MALVVKDRVKEITSTTGTGTITLLGAVSGYQSFSTIGDANTTFYAIIDSNTGDWEVGSGTYTSSGATLSRTTVLESSNAGSLVSFGAGVKEVFCTYPAERSVYVDGTTITPATAATLPVIYGGTGASTLTANNVLLGNGTSALQAVAPSTTGNVLTSNGTTWTSAPAAAGGGTLEAIATGALSNGSAVVINSDGTVSVVVVSADSAGAPAVFESANTNTISATYSSISNKVVIAYTDADNSSFGTAIVGTVSGTSISFGTAVVFESANSASISATYDLTNNKVVIAYRNLGNLGFGTSIVGIVSGTSISFGTAVVFESANTNAISATYSSISNKVVIAYADAGNSSFGTSIVGTVSGTSISFGTAVVFESATSSIISATYDSTNNRVVIAYSDLGNSNFGTAIVGTVSGTSISFGTAVVFESANTNAISATYSSISNKVVIAYQDNGNSSFGTAIVGTVSGTSISFGTAVVFESANSPFISATYDSTNNKVVIAYQDNGNLSFGTAVTMTLASVNLTSENYIGISDAAYANGATATIQIVGAVDDAQSSLIAGQSYYVQLNGTLGLTPASPSVFAGTAVSATKIIVKG